jgi:hypothetical protein
MLKLHHPSSSFRTAYFSLIAFLVLFSISIVHPADEASVYPGKLGIQKGRNLSAAEREVEARFAEYLEKHTDEAIARYTKKYGKEINTDNARELSTDYAPGGVDADDQATRAARTKWSSAVHEPSSAFTREIYRRALTKIPPPNQRKQVIFTAGGAGAGKTTSIQQIPGLTQAVEAGEIIYDTTLSSLKTSTERIGQAISAGRMVSIIFVYRDPIDSFVGGILPRAERTGRILPLEAFLDTHIGAAAVLAKIAEAHRDDDRVAIAVIDNSRGRGKAAPSDIGFVKSAAAKYRRDELREALLSALETAYEKGKRGQKEGISESIYRGIKGHAP